jgi:flagellar hook-associated protein 3 FlgL
MNRISTSYQYSSYSHNIASTQQRYMQIQNQIGTGKRIQNPSDDPMGVASIVNMRSLKSASERYQNNLKVGEGVLKFSEEALADTSTLFRRAYQLAVSGANAATDQTGREAMVREVTEMQKRLVSVANSRGPNNSYIFAGQKVDTQPFTQNTTDITYNGDTNSIIVQTSPTETLAVNVNAGQMFVDAYATLESLKNNLQSGNTGAISGIDITEVQNVMRQMDNERGAIGAKLHQVQTLETDYQRRIDEFSNRISEVEDVDMATAITEYHLAETAYTAALNVASQGFRLSLMDFIRG